MIRSIKVTALLFVLMFVVTGCASKKCELAVAGCKKPCDTGGCGNTSKWTAFGNKMKLTSGKPICASEILADKAKHADKLIRICGKVDTVCAKKGCWIRLAGPITSETLFVKFTCPVNGRLVPMDAVGRLAIVEGVLELKEISEDEARHYAEDSGKSAEEIAKIVGPQQIVKLNSPSAIIDLTKKIALAD